MADDAIEVTAPDGYTQTFPAGTTRASVDAAMRQYWAQRGQTQGGIAQTPPGMQPGPMNAKSPSIIQQEMVPLSPGAERAERMLTQGAVTNNKTMEQGARLLLEKDPTYQARKKQSEGMGEAASKRNEMRIAGENILAPFAKLYHAWENTPDDERAAATGPANMAKLQETSPTYIPWTTVPIPGLSGPTTVDPRTKAPIAGQITPVQRAAIMNPDDKAAAAAADVQTRYGHLSKGITNALLASAAKGMTMSDKRQEMFASAMEDFAHAPTKQGQRKILEDAKAIIQTDFNLTPEEADLVLRKNFEHIAQEQQRKMVFNAAQAPPNAVWELLANHKKPGYVHSFNKHFNGDEPGLAEHLIRSAADNQ